MPKAEAEEKRWSDFERELAEAVAKDMAVTKRERQAWLDTLPEHVWPGPGRRVRVIFFKGKRQGK